MKTAKLVFGIFSIVLSVMVLFQSCAAHLYDAVNGSYAGTYGMFVAILMLAGGITNIVTRTSKGGTWACIIMFGLAGVIAVTMYDYYEDLQVWGAYCLIVAVVNLISLKTQFKAEKKEVTEEKAQEKDENKKEDEV